MRGSGGATKNKQIDTFVTTCNKKYIYFFKAVCVCIFFTIIWGIDCTVYKKGFKCQSSTQIATNIPNPNQCFSLALQNQNCNSFNQIELDRNGNCWCATNCEEGHGSYYNVFACTETSK